MSHFTKLAKANIVDPDAFEAAANELGFRTERNAAGFSYSGQNKLHGEVVAKICKGEDVVLVKNKEGTYDMMADWGYRGAAMAQAAGLTTGTEFQNRLLQLTTKHTLINKYRRDGWMARFVEDENKKIKMTLTKY